MGIMLGMGVVAETGVLTDIAQWVDAHIGDIWIVGIISGLLSSLIDTFTIAVSDISLYSIAATGEYGQNGNYWLLIAYSTAVGGCLLSVGSACGIALMQMEHIHLGWYFKRIAPKVLIGWLVGMAVLYAECTLF